MKKVRKKRTISPADCELNRTKKKCAGVCTKSKLCQKMDWNENDETNNDRCSTASSASTPAESNGSNLSPSATSAAVNHLKGANKGQNGFNASTNQDSMSDGDLSDFSLNDSDEDEFRSHGKQNVFSEVKLK